VIDGVTNSATTVPAGTFPSGIAVNPLTNKIYVTNRLDNTVTVLDGQTNLTSTVPVGTLPFAIDIDVLRNQIYVADFAGGSITTIDGSTNTPTTVSTGNAIVNGVAVNPFTNKIYSIGLIEDDVTVLNGIDSPLSPRVLQLTEGSNAEGDQ